MASVAVTQMMNNNGQGGGMRRNYRSGPPPEQSKLSSNQLAGLKQNWSELSLGVRVYLLLNEPDSSAAAKAIAVTVMVLILISTASFCIETLPQFSKPDSPDKDHIAFDIVEYVCIAAFTVEYALRLVASMYEPVAPVAVEAENSKPKAKHQTALQFQLNEAERQLEEFIPSAKISGSTRALRIWKFIKEPLNIIDLAAILPFYIELAVESSGDGGLAVLRVLRLARVFRVFKFGKYSRSVQLLTRVLAASKEAFVLLIFFISLAAILFGALIYFAEGGEYDEATGKYLRDDIVGSAKEETPFHSIPHAFWWVVVTAVTVGYGDQFPTSPLGKVVAVVLMHLGVIFIALPITIIGSNFAAIYTEELNRENARQEEELLDNLKSELRAINADNDNDNEGASLRSASVSLEDAGATTQHLIVQGGGREPTAGGSMSQQGTPYVASPRNKGSVVELSMDLEGMLGLAVAAAKQAHVAAEAALAQALLSRQVVQALAEAEGADASALLPEEIVTDGGVCIACAERGGGGGLVNDLVEALRGRHQVEAKSSRLQELIRRAKEARGNSTSSAGERDEMVAMLESPRRANTSSRAGGRYDRSPSGRGRSLNRRSRPSTPRSARGSGDDGLSLNSTLDV